MRALQNENSLRQGPCLVASVLEAVCREIGKYWMHTHKLITREDFQLRRFFIPLDVYGVSPLQNGQHYSPPRGNSSGDLACECDTVIYRYVAVGTDHYDVTDVWWTITTASIQSLYGVFNVSGRKHLFVCLNKFCALCLYADVSLCLVLM